MDTKTDLEKLERAAFRKFYGDGIFDIYLGALFLMIPFLGYFSDSIDSEVVSLVVTAGFAGVLVLAFALARRFITRPRIGSFKPSPSRRVKLAKTRIILGLSIVAGLGVMWLVAGDVTGDPMTWLPLAWLANSILVFGVMAYYLDVPRFFIYGVMFGLTVMVDSWAAQVMAIEIPAIAVFGVPSLIAIVIGAVILRRFLQEYPVIPAEKLAETSNA